MIRIKNTQYFHFLEQADALRRSGLLCDVVVSVKTQTFRAHRLVLACASKTLAQHLTQGDRAGQAQCTLEGFPPHTFQQVLDFTYTQALDVSVDDLIMLLRAAQLLQMHLLEDECKKQLDSLNCSKGSHVAEANREKQSPNRDERLKESPVYPNQDLRERSSPVEKISVDVLVENVEPGVHLKNGLPSKRRRFQPSPEPEPVRGRDSVITMPTTSISSFCSPWTLSANMWESVSSLRQIAATYSHHRPIHPFPAAQPFTPSSPHMVPLINTQHQTPAQSSSVSYSGLHPYSTQNLLIDSTQISSIIKDNLLKRKRQKRRELAKNIKRDEFSSRKGSKGGAESVRRCEAHGAAKPEDSLLPNSAAAQQDRRCSGCQYCSQGNTCESHTRRDVKGEKPHQCHHCPKKFSLKHQLDTHHRVHTGEKPFECRLCGQRSRDYSAMIKHLRTHGGASPYQCTVCLEYCSSLVAMQRHVKCHPVQDFPPDWSISCTYMYISHI